MELKAINDLNRHVKPLAAALEGAVSRVLASGWFVLGPEVRAFEESFALYNQAEYCVTVANGTDAIELALRALDIGPGKKVATVANAGMYSTAAVLAVGATPVYIDINSETSLLDTDDLDRILKETEISVVIVTHLYGLMADIPEVLSLTKQRNIPIIEDCAQAHGAMLENKKAGTFGDIGCFSFYPTKNLGALGDGGAIITSRGELADKVRQLRQYGWESKYRATLPGGKNSRLDEMQAAILRVKLPYLDQWNARRRELATRYSTGITHNKVKVQPVRGQEFVGHLYVVKAADRDALKRHLADHGIPSDIHYPIPDYRQPSCSHLFQGINKRATEQDCAQVLTLPCFPEMEDSEVDAIINCINKWQP